MPNRWHGGSKEERVVDALAWTGDEGRDKLRKATGSCTKASIRGSPNGATQQVEDLLLRVEYIGAVERTRGTETSKYPEEEKSIEIPLVVASERGTAQTGLVTANPGL